MAVYVVVYGDLCSKILYDAVVNCACDAVVNRGAGRGSTKREFGRPRVENLMDRELRI